MRKGLAMTDYPLPQCYTHSKIVVSMPENCLTAMKTPPLSHTHPYTYTLAMPLNMSGWITGEW